MNPSRTRFHDMLPDLPRSAINHTTSMPSYWRNFFGGQQTTPSNSSGSQTKHQRSSSVPQPPPHCNGSYIYATPGTASSSASSADGRARSSSFVGSRSTAPSPLRYESNSVRSRSQAASQSASQQQPTRVPLYRTSSHNKASERRTYSIRPVRRMYLRSISSNPIFFIQLPRIPFTPRRYRSAAHVLHPARRFILVQHQGIPTRLREHPALVAWVGAAPRFVQFSSRIILGMDTTAHLVSPSFTCILRCVETTGILDAHVSFKNDPRGSSASNSLHVHPLLACSRLHSAPISYDITYTPSSRSVIDKTTNIAVAATTLAQPATNPPTSSRLVLKADKLPWPIVVSPSHVSSSSSSKPKSAPRFYIHGSHSGHGSSSSSGSPHVSNLDVLYAVHSTLFTRITQEEWEQLGHGSRSQRKITRAYEKRCIKMGGGWEGGVRRLDWLGGKTRLVGIELDKSGDGTGKLLFSKA
ncbi:hypothetical protein EYR36_002865 [Pleurotus pulmonarius]|nr:hypothetical protein EYR36_002865 [Pleurotus pulmonarius]